MVTREGAEDIVGKFIVNKRNCADLYVNSVDDLGYGSWRVKGEYTLRTEGKPETLFFEILLDPRGKITYYDLNKPVPIF